MLIRQHDYCTGVPEGAFTPDANEAKKSRVVGRFSILCLLASFACEIHAIRAWNSLHNRCEYASWEGLLPGSSSLIAKCIPVFVKVRRCIYSSGYPQTTHNYFVLHCCFRFSASARNDVTARCEYPQSSDFSTRIIHVNGASNAQFAPHNTRHSHRSFTQ